MRIHAIPFSTNVERVALALGLKGVDPGPDAWVVHDPGDRAGVRAVSDQDLVPVLETGDGGVVTDSMAIVAWIEAKWPEPALWPADPARRREVDAFIGFFNHVWKVPPNALHDGAGDPEAWVAQLRGWQHGFEALLHGRDFLFGDAPGASDVCAYPFLKFGCSADPEDDDLFHGVLIEHLALDGRFPRLAAWIGRMAAIPRPTF